MESLPQENMARGSSARGEPPPAACDEAMEFRPVEAANDTRMSQLARTIELEIIPRLMMAHRTGTDTLVGPPAAGPEIGPEDVRQFAKLVLANDEDISFATIEKLRRRDVSVERIYLDLLAPTARYLGELWNDDLCTFTDVTVGLGRLQRVLRELSPALGRSVAHPVQGRRVLLLPSPGEQHTFGLVMVAEFFRRSGWNVTGGAWAAGADAAALAGAEWFDVVGFSLGAEVHLDRLAAAIQAVRHAACNRSLRILVGGPIFGAHPEFADRVGADGMTIDGREVPSLAESLIAGRSLMRVPPG